MQILTGKFQESTFIRIKLHVHIMSEPTTIIILVQGPFLPMVLRHRILAHWVVYHVESNSDLT
jgi:hypothetical protein